MGPGTVFRGLGAGIAAVLGWHAAILASWMFEGNLPIIACAAATGLIVNFLLYQRGLARFLVSLAAGALFAFLGMLAASEFDLTAIILKAAIPGLRRIPVAARYAGTVTGTIFLAALALSLLIAFAIHPRQRKQAEEASAE